ncbi:hypothetical protein V6N12_044436 [Hibiscus sabdariffa]|uniref:Uncharacterized protein n=1 Tax=Hibiscus sabdariffa TaxID=183260 RepID=A0ABR2BMW3_9ROSI
MFQDERCLKEISRLKRKGAQLKEENQRLKQVIKANHLQTLGLMGTIIVLTFLSHWGYLSRPDRRIRGDVVKK